MAQPIQRSLAISNQAGRAEDKHVLPRDESHCFQQPIRSRSLTAHERDHVNKQRTVKGANDRWIGCAVDATSCGQIRKWTNKFAIYAFRIKGKCQVRFKYVGNLSEKCNLEEKSRLLKFLEICDRWNWNLCFQGLLHWLHL